MSVQILPPDNVTEVAPGSLLSLKQAGFKDWEWVHRDLDRDHVERLAACKPSELPPIDVVRVQLADGRIAYAIVDGYHRREAALLRKDATIAVRCGRYENEQAVIQAAFESNLKHGLPASKKTRTNYALWIYYCMPGGRRLGIGEIARRAGLHKSVVSRAIRQHESTDSDEESPTPRQHIDYARLFVRALHQFFTHKETFISSLFGDGTAQRDVEKRAKVLHDYLKSLDADTQQQRLKELRSLRETLALLEQMFAPQPAKK